MHTQRHDPAPHVVQVEPSTVEQAEIRERAVAGSASGSGRAVWLRRDRARARMVLAGLTAGGLGVILGVVTLLGGMEPTGLLRWLLVGGGLLVMLCLAVMMHSLITLATGPQCGPAASWPYHRAREPKS